MGMVEDLGAELAFWQAVEVLDLIAEILSNNPRWGDVAAQIAEHHPELTPYQQQLEVKCRLVEGDPRGGAELAALLRAAAS